MPAFGAGRRPFWQPLPQGVPTAASLLRAIDVLRDMNAAARPSLPKSAPTRFLRERWARYLLPGGAIDRRYYELCVLSELRNRLRAGDVWVVGSRRYRSFEERLISRETSAVAATERHLANCGRCRFRTFHRGPPHSPRRAAGGGRTESERRIASGRHIRERRAKDHADREIDAAGSRGLARTPLRDAAADPRHRPAIRGGGLDAVYRLLHPSAKRRGRCRPTRPDGEPCGRWA